MSTKWRHNIGYGLIPSLTLITFFYLIHLSNNIYNSGDYDKFIATCMITSLFSIFLILIRKAFTFLNIMYFVGFRKVKIEKLFLFFFTYYIIISSVFIYIFPSLLQTIHVTWFIFTPIVICLLIYTVIKYFVRVSVTFIKITPRLYLDLINKELHTIEDIKDYYVNPILENNLDYDRYNFTVDIVKQNKIESKNFKSKLHKIDDIKYKLSNNNKEVILTAFTKDNIVWESKFKTKNKTISKEKLNEIINSIMTLENL